MRNDVTVCIPSIPPRKRLLMDRALPSVMAQTAPANAVAISVDVDKEGAWTNRNKTIEMANTKWIAFLDDDDELLPHHLAHLLGLAHDTGANVAWGWFQVVNGTDPFPQHRGRYFDIADPHIFPITALVDRELVCDAHASFQPDASSGNWGLQDFPFWKALWDAGGKFQPSDEITWRWHHHGKNTSGLPQRW